MKDVTIDRHLKQLPAGWEKSDGGYILRTEHGTCEIKKVEKTWVVVNTNANGSKWAQGYPSFKQVLEGVLRNY